MFEGPVGLSPQIHDFNPGIEENGLFWTAAIDPHAASVSPGSGRAEMRVENLEMEDYHDLVNALLDGPSLEGLVSFHVAWNRSGDRRRFHSEADQYDGNVLINTAKCTWSGTTSQAVFVSDPADTSVTVSAIVGHVRNGVFFS